MSNLNRMGSDVSAGQHQAVKFTARRLKVDAITASPIQSGAVKTNARTKVKPPLTRLIRVGTIGDCPKCKSTTVKKYILLGKVIGCIHPECENYYKLIEKGE